MFCSHFAYAQSCISFALLWLVFISPGSADGWSGFHMLWGRKYSYLDVTCHVDVQMELFERLVGGCGVVIWYYLHVTYHRKTDGEKERKCSNFYILLYNLSSTLCLDIHSNIYKPTLPTSYLVVYVNPGVEYRYLSVSRVLGSMSLSSIIYYC